MASVMQPASFHKEMNPVCLCQASQWKYWQMELTKCHWPSLYVQRLHYAANAPVSCPAGDFVRTDVTINKPKEKRESSCPHLSPGFQSSSELVLFTINYLMLLEFNTGVSKIFRKKNILLFFTQYLSVSRMSLSDDNSALL